MQTLEQELKQLRESRFTGYWYSFAVFFIFTPFIGIPAFLITHFTYSGDINRIENYLKENTNA